MLYRFVNFISAICCIQTDGFRKAARVENCQLPKLRILRL